MEDNRTSDDRENPNNGGHDNNNRRLAASTNVVDVIDTSARRRSSPFVSPSGGAGGSALRTVQEFDGTEIPVAHPEEGGGGGQRQQITSPRHRRGSTPTTSASRRQSSNHRITYEDLASRPRSNPRSRTPMRYESPLEHGAFRTDNNNTVPEVEDTFQARTITIRPGAGLGVGVTRPLPERRYFDDNNTRPQPITLKKSTKQGPSKRKTRRWNNDNFVNTYNDLKSSSSAKGRAAADILVAAKADAKHFLSVYDPTNTQQQRSAKVSNFMTKGGGGGNDSNDDRNNNDKYSHIRDKFFNGELHPSQNPTNRPSCKPKEEQLDNNSRLLSPSDMFLRIDNRLRRVVVKACENSAPACKVVGYFENYLCKVFEQNQKQGVGASSSSGTIDCDFWEELLLEQPTISHKVTTSKNGNNDDDNKKTRKTTSVTFLFDGDSSTGGFHRLLVHAVSLFHCLKVTTSTTTTTTTTGLVDDGGAVSLSRKARVLTVQGVWRGGYHLLDHLDSLQEAKRRQ